MNTTKLVRRLFNVNSKTANRLLYISQEQAWLALNHSYLNINERFHDWLDRKGLEVPCGFVNGEINPEWKRLRGLFIEEGDFFTPQQEAYVLGFWDRKSRRAPAWRGDEETMVRWMLTFKR